MPNLNFIAQYSINWYSFWVQLIHLSIQMSFLWNELITSEKYSEPLNNFTKYVFVTLIVFNITYKMSRGCYSDDLNYVGKVPSPSFAKGFWAKLDL